MKEYYILDNLEKLNKVINYLNQHKNGVVALDTETSGLDYRECQLMGISLSIRPQEAFYFVLHEYIDEEIKIIDAKEPYFYRAVKAFLLEFLSSSQIVCHNASFDVMVLRKTMGIDILPYLYFDTILGKHLINEERPHDLKSCAKTYLGLDASEQKDLEESVLRKGGKWTKLNREMYKGDTEILGKYACADVDMTFQLFFEIYNRLEDDKLVQFYFEETHPLLKVIINHLLERGIYCDIPYFKNLKLELTARMGELEKQAHQDLQNNHTSLYDTLERKILEEKFPLKTRGKLVSLLARMKEQKKTLEEEELLYQARVCLYKEKTDSSYIINFQSTKQLKQILFEGLGETPIKQTKKGTNQVDETTLKAYSEKYKWVECLMEYRKLGKLLKTYVENILELQKENVIYPQWLQFGTDSGRFASRNINAQNIPNNDKTIKKGLIARPGYVLIDADYSQLEPRIFSHLSNEGVLINAFNKGEDFYGTLAVDIFNLPCSPNEVKSKYPKERDKTKTLALGIAYGAKKRKIGEILKIAPEEAQQIIDKYFQLYTNLYKFIKISHGQAIRNEFVQTELGRKRRFKDINKLKHSNDKALQRTYYRLLNLSVNFKIQGLAASLINRAMILIDQKIKEKGYDAYLIAQIHDELVIECKEEQAKYVSAIVKDCMENIYKLKVPLIAEPKICGRLSEAK